MITLEEAISYLQDEKVVAVPTETVYGLAAKVDSEKAIQAIYELKGRPKTKPLTVNVASFFEILPFLDTRPKSFEKMVFTKLAFAFWPGPLTLILPIKKGCMLPCVTSGLDNCGFRIPRHALILKLIKEVGPIVLPSANISGRAPCKAPAEIEKDFGKEVPILKGEGCQIGIESTVMGFEENKWVVFRLGAINQKQLYDVLGYYPVIKLIDKEGEKNVKA